MSNRSRFLQVDPIEGGSCNDYDYVCGDPVNKVDLDGRISSDNPNYLFAGEYVIFNADFNYDTNRLRWDIILTPPLIAEASSPVLWSHQTWVNGVRTDQNTRLKPQPAQDHYHNSIGQFQQPGEPRRRLRVGDVVRIRIEALYETRDGGGVRVVCDVTLRINK